MEVFLHVKVTCLYVLCPIQISTVFNYYIVDETSNIDLTKGGTANNSDIGAKATNIIKIEASLAPKQFSQMVVTIVAVAGICSIGSKQSLSPGYINKSSKIQWILNIIKSVDVMIIVKDNAKGQRCWSDPLGPLMSGSIFLVVFQRRWGFNKKKRREDKRRRKKRGGSGML